MNDSFITNMEYMDMKLKKILLSLVMAFSLFTGMTFAADKVDLNTANQAQLEMLNGVGASTAAAIIDYREKHGAYDDSVDALVLVKGIGDKKLAKLIEYIEVSKPE
jgi:competence protein ComEA